MANIADHLAAGFCIFLKITIVAPPFFWEVNVCFVLHFKSHVFRSHHIRISTCIMEFEALDSSEDEEGIGE